MSEDTTHTSHRDKSRKETPQKLTQLSSRSHPRHLVGKGTAQKDTIIDITSDSQSTCIATFCLTFYGSWNFRFLGRNGIARLSGMTAIYFSMILF